MNVARSWRVLHVQSDAPNARYLTAAAREALGYAPASREEGGQR